MSVVESLMIQSVTLLTPTDVVQNAIGEAVDDDPSELETLMYLEPVSGTEEQLNRDTPIADWKGFGKVSVPFRSECRIVYGSHVFRIISDPRPFFDPELGTFSHTEMDLKEIDDSAAFDA